MTFLEQLLLVLVASLFSTLAFRRLRLPPVVAYLIAGALIGPHFLDWVRSPEDFSLIAEFGVAFLLFSIGLEFSLEKLWRLRFAVFGVGALQVLSCGLVFGGVIYLWGAGPIAAGLFAVALTFSSTALVSRELHESRQLQAGHGKTALGVLLFQDLVAVVFLALIPVLGEIGADAFALLLATALLKGVMLSRNGRISLITWCLNGVSASIMPITKPPNAIDKPSAWVRVAAARAMTSVASTKTSSAPTRATSR